MGLLKTALTWVLLSPENQLSAREVIDAFQDTYDVIYEMGEVSGEAEAVPGFPGIISGDSTA